MVPRHPIVELGLPLAQQVQRTASRASYHVNPTWLEEFPDGRCRQSLAVVEEHTLECCIFPPMNVPHDRRGLVTQFVACSDDPHEHLIVLTASGQRPRPEGLVETADVEHNAPTHGEVRACPKVSRRVRKWPSVLITLGHRERLGHEIGAPL